MYVLLLAMSVTCHGYTVRQLYSAMLGCAKQAVAMPFHAMPCRAVLCCAVLCCAVLRCAVMLVCNLA